MRASTRLALGGTGLSLTALGLGGAPLGGMFEPVSDAAAEATITAAFELGVRYFDVAPLYGYGLAERRFGEGLAGQPRDAFVVSTKVGRLVGPRTVRPDDDIFVGAPPGTAYFDFSRDGVLRSLEASLERLSLDRVDIVFIHDPDDHGEAALTQAYPALEELRAARVVDAIGLGMNQTQMLTHFVEETDIDVVLCAGRYTLLDQSALDELLPACERRRVSVVIGGVYNSGILADPAPGARFNYAVADQHLVERARQLAEICDRHGVTLKAAAIQFPVGHPAVVSVLTGARSKQELIENVAMFERPIPPGLWPELVSAGLLPPAAPFPGRAP